MSPNWNPHTITNKGGHGQSGQIYATEVFPDWQGIVYGLLTIIYVNELIPKLLSYPRFIMLLAPPPDFPPPHVNIEYFLKLGKLYFGYNGKLSVVTDHGLRTCADLFLWRHLGKF